MSDTYDIEMFIDETLELDAIIQDWDPNTSLIDVSGGSYSSEGLQKNTFIFNPDESGTYTITVNGQTLTVEVKDNSSIPDINISQEEDGNISEWSGNMNASTTTSPTITGSSYSISTRTNGNEQYIKKDFEQARYVRFSFYLYPIAENNEIIFYNTNTSEPLFCIYTSQRKNGFHYSDPVDKASEGWSGDNLVGGSRRSGKRIISSVSKKYYHVEVYPNYTKKTCDVYVDGTNQLTDVTFSSESGPANSCILNCNDYNNDNGTYVDKIDALSE